MTGGETQGEHVNDILLDWLVALGTVAGGGIAAYVTARLARRSQMESNKINEANGLVERYDTFTAAIQADRAHDRSAAAEARKQISLWRRYAQQLRGQIYRLGGVPDDAPAELDL